MVKERGEVVSEWRILLKAFFKFSNNAGFSIIIVKRNIRFSLMDYFASNGS